jgi:RNA recognition motif-containing protein
MLLELLDARGFACKYDFVYIPMDFNRNSSLGYAFVNFVTQADAEMAKNQLNGFSDWIVQSQKVCQVCWGEPLQGLEAHIERYRSSPVMHNSVPDEFKPIIFKNGVRVPFPAPTKRIRKPRANDAA